MRNYLPAKDPLSISSFARSKAYSTVSFSASIFISRYCTVRLVVFVICFLYVVKTRFGMIAGIFHLGFNLIHLLLLGSNNICQILVNFIYCVHALVDVANFFLTFAHDLFLQFLYRSRSCMTSRFADKKGSKGKGGSGYKRWSA